MLVEPRSRAAPERRRARSEREDRPDLGGRTDVGIHDLDRETRRLHLLVEVLIDDEAVSTEGMQAFDLPDIVVPYGEHDADPAQAVAFALHLIPGHVVDRRFALFLHGQFNQRQIHTAHQVEKGLVPG